MVGRNEAKVFLKSYAYTWTIFTIKKSIAYTKYLALISTLKPGSSIMIALISDNWYCLKRKTPKIFFSPPKQIIGDHNI